MFCLYGEVLVLKCFCSEYLIKVECSWNWIDCEFCIIVCDLLLGMISGYIDDC